MRSSLRWISISTIAGFGVWIVIVGLRGRLEPVGLLGLIVATLTLVVEIRADQREATRPEPTADELAHELARILDEQWREEARARLLRDPQLLPLTWRRTTAPVKSSGNEGGDDLEYRLNGDFDAVVTRLAEAFDTLTVGRLLLLGQPGAGKSVLALLLQIGLLRRCLAAGGGDRPVPVLLSVAAWDPLSEDLDGFLVRMLTTVYYGGRTDVPTRLLAAERLLPILDGLDEIPEHARGAAVIAINDALEGTDKPVIVTCRSVEYTDLIRAGAPALYDADGLEVQPIRPRDAVAYLRGITWPPGISWDQVFSEMQRPKSPLAETYSTPLMVSIARTVYQRLGGNPNDQLAHRSRLAAENALLDRVVDAAYRTAGGPQLTPWTAEEAARHLSVLARLLHHHRERDLLWWRMPQRMLSAWVALYVGLSAGALMLLGSATWVASAFGEQNLAFAISIGAIIGGGFGILITFVWYAGSNSMPGRLSIARRGSFGRLRRGFLAGTALSALLGVPTAAAFAVATSLVGGWSQSSAQTFLERLGLGCVASVVVGIALGINSWMQAPPPRAQLVQPLGFLRQDRWSSLVGAGAAGVVFAVLLGPALVAGAVAGDLLLGWATGWAGWPGRLNVGALIKARSIDFTLATFGSPYLAIGALVVLPGVVFASLVLLTRAWPRFQIMRVLLAVRHELPWRLSRFLEDARKRDVLRQSAGAYQFRHVRLQERLADERAARPETILVGVRSRRRHRTLRAVAAVAALLACIAVPLWIAPDNHADRTLALPYHHGGDQAKIVPSPSGDSLATLIGDDLDLWRLPSGDHIAHLAVGDDAQPRYSPDGNKLLAASDDGPNLVVRADSGKYWPQSPARIIVSSSSPAPRCSQR